MYNFTDKSICGTVDTWVDTQVRGQDLVTRNLKRVVEVWLDEQHKQYFYTRHPLHK